MTNVIEVSNALHGILNSLSKMKDYKEIKGLSVFDDRGKLKSLGQILNDIKEV